MYTCEFFNVLSLLRTSHNLFNMLYKLERASQVAPVVKNPPAKQETQVRSLGWEDPLEEGMAPHSSILAWRIPWTVQCGPYWATVQWVTKSQTWLKWLSMHVQAEELRGDHSLTQTRPSRYHPPLHKFIQSVDHTFPFTISSLFVSPLTWKLTISAHLLTCVSKSLLFLKSLHFIVRLPRNS